MPSAQQDGMLILDNLSIRLLTSQLAALGMLAVLTGL
jgi:hypothetical protein